MRLSLQRLIRGAERFVRDCAAELRVYGSVLQLLRKGMRVVVVAPDGSGMGALLRLWCFGKKF